VAGKKSNKCDLCGDCCRDFAIDLRDEDLNDPDFIRFVELHGCKFDKKEGHVEIPLKCKMLDSNNKCKIYENRPNICREWIPKEDCED